MWYVSWANGTMYNAYRVYVLAGFAHITVDVWSVCHVCSSDPKSSNLLPLSYLPSTQPHTGQVHVTYSSVKRTSMSMYQSYRAQTLRLKLRCYIPLPPLFCVVQLALFVRYSWSWFYFSLWCPLSLSMGTVVLDSSSSLNTGPGSPPLSCKLQQAISHYGTWLVSVLCASTFSSGLQSYLLDKYQTGVSDRAVYMYV